MYLELPNTDGSWAAWGSWTTCTTTCDPGTTHRSRTCTDPAPYGLGADCPNSDTEASSCEVTPCPGKSHATSCPDDNLSRKENGVGIF